MFKKILAALSVIHFALAVEPIANDAIPLCNKTFGADPPFSETYVSSEEIHRWLDQFDPEDQESAKLLLSTIDFYSYKRILKELVIAHRKLLDTMKEQGIDSSKVDYSKTYSAKSGDLISYFYRKANKLRGADFQNIEALTHKDNDRSDRCLVLLEDYLGSGLQFLYGCYGRKHADLFNSYRKVFLVVLVANTQAIKRFEQLNQGNNSTIAQEFARIVCPWQLTSEQEMLDMINKIPKGKLELIFAKEEKPLTDILAADKEQGEIESLLNKYNLTRYFGGNFAIGHTVFFYSSPNNLPEILWNTKSIKRDGSPWIPLFSRVEDLSIYFDAQLVPQEEQVWGKSISDL